MCDRIYTLDELREIVAPIAKTYGAKSMHLFGSYARGEADRDSDIDLIVDRGNSPLLSGWGLGGLYEDLHDKLDKEIDVLTPAMLSDSFRESIRNEEVLLYAE